MDNLKQMAYRSGLMCVWNKLESNYLKKQLCCPAEKHVTRKGQTIDAVTSAPHMLTFWCCTTLRTDWFIWIQVNNNILIRMRLHLIRALGQVSILRKPHLFVCISTPPNFTHINFPILITREMKLLYNAGIIKWARMSFSARFVTLAYLRTLTVEKRLWLSEFCTTLGGSIKCTRFVARTRWAPRWIQWS